MRRQVVYDTHISAVLIRFFLQFMDLSRVMPIIKEFEYLVVYTYIITLIFPFNR